MGADSDGSIQHFIWNHLLSVPLLGRNDHISWHDHADGNLVNHHLDSESI